MGQLRLMALVRLLGGQDAAAEARLPDRGGQGRAGLGRRRRGAPAPWLILVKFPSDSCRSVVIDMGGTAPKPLRRACRGRILFSLSGFSSVSTTEKPGGVIPARPGRLREDRGFSPRSAHEGIAASGVNCPSQAAGYPHPLKCQGRFGRHPNPRRNPNPLRRTVRFARHPIPRRD